MKEMCFFPYDLSTFNARRDNEHGGITRLVERIKTDFATFAKRELVPFLKSRKLAGCKTGDILPFKAF